ncbi:hypothetical protein Agabi119p4_6176 [Agaricus bisporus var. burnettii]|uniref:Uncharacterized protein n=1 Tax=Agaricus bisporus var. burnettii TaxID=192524 RepID=A0A8H7F1D0_AGABI|nr:hypothetical protein Agabi119p4_6176 [Agaricus bisporus var. burnettii]
MPDESFCDETGWGGILLSTPVAACRRKRTFGAARGDLGMEVERKMDPKQLAKSLGFKNYLPFSFNVYRHKFGTSAWEDETLFNFPEEQSLPAFIDFMRLHWHQLAGIHSIIRSIFLEKPDNSHPAGVLIGDEVGLGKTAQSIAFIAFLNQAIYMQENRLRVPPILTARPYLGGDETIPSLPHLILCPGTIAAQWVSELKTLFLPWSVDIFTYDSRVDSPWFWGQEGPIRTSKHKAHNRIVVATHSAIFAEFKKLHNPIRRKDSRPWLIPSTAPSKTVKGTIFGQDFLSIIVDEAHHMRNPGNKHVSTLRLLRQARIKVIMTATPLHTAPKDIASLGRLVGIPHFSDEASHTEEKDDGSTVRRAKKFDDEGATLLRHFLRRTVASTNWEGKVLLPLPEPKEIIGLLQLSDREAAIIAERAKAAKDAIESSSKRIQTKKFYLEYRLAVGYAKEDISGLNPEFKTLEDWEPLKSTKMDVCARICAHYLKHDHMDDVHFENGKPVFPVFPEIPGERLPKRRRIIIYSEFPSMAPLLQNVLRLYGVASLAINGEIPFHQRDKRVKDLYDDKHPARVLVFSAVAAVGLNLAIADVVIFFDQPWSSQDERQVRGRAHRQPQKKVVKVIHLLAINSADTVMYSVARGKENMFDAFVNKELADELRSLLEGAVPDDPSENPGMEDDQLGNKKPAVKKTKRRTKQVLASGNQDAGPSATTDVDSSINISDGDRLTLGVNSLDGVGMISGSTATDNEEILAKRDCTKQILPGGNEDNGPDPAINVQGDGIYFISESISSGGIVLDSFPPSYPDTSTENDLVNSFRQTSVSPGSHFDCQDNQVAREREVTPPSLSMLRPPAKRARHGTISEETRSNLVTVEDLPKPASRSVVSALPKLSSNEQLPITRIPPSQTFPVQSRRRSDQSIMQVQPPSSAIQISSMASSRPAESVAAVREQRRAKPLPQKTPHPTQVERQNLLIPSNPPPPSSREVPSQRVGATQQTCRSQGTTMPSSSNSRRGEPNRLTSADSAINRPRQQGSSAVPPKAALKYNHHQHQQHGPKDKK